MSAIVENYVQYQDRREKLSSLFPDSLILLVSAERDPTRVFVQDSYFYYFTGLDFAIGILVLWPQALPHRVKSILALPDLSESERLWHGLRWTSGIEAARQAGFDQAIPENKIWDLLDKAFSRIRRLVHPQPLNHGLGTRRLENYLNQIREKYPSISIECAKQPVDDMRCIKDPHEIDRIRQAIAISGEGFKKAIAEIHPGIYEYEIQARVEFEFRRRGAMGPAFPTIIAAGPRGTILHYDRNSERIELKDLIIIDMGARYKYYCADISRTIPASGRFTKEQKSIYLAVLETQRRVIEQVRPGVRIRNDLQSLAYEVLKKHGLEQYFPHSIGHFLGIDVHDTGDTRRPLEPGMVITVEPGVYIPEINLGIRLEDNILVTSEGAKVLSAAIPKEPNKIESIMKGHSRASPQSPPQP